ncbi:hypothetical protein HPB51_022170 [Rhipicephalus microplus]|uniref:Reverse transcriptase domain-containing protein n=1 Tax=Rhipicephalus microplus TaxID=6941 RepID=A0A9J6E465_RHIMP|nr:hypothetical protein HPB51_022170 [Rhipicephalus microplus]
MSLYYKLLCHNGSASALYRLPKIHKPNIAVRPILDYTCPPQCELSRYLHRIPRPLAKLTESFIKDSVHFIEQLRDVRLDDDEVMVSYNVNSMFTCVPIDYPVEFCKKLLEMNSSLPQRMPFKGGRLPPSEILS